MRILVAEDEKKTATFIRTALVAEGFAVDVVHNGTDALATALTNSFDVLVVDIMMPGRDGLSLVRQLRERGVATPVLLVSARGQTEERIEGLNAGADDYLPKPFAIGELIARLRALGRRGIAGGSVMLNLADLSMDTIKREVRRRGRLIDLSLREFKLLEFLMRRPNRVFGRMEILESVWGYDFNPGTNLVDVCIRRIRDKVDSDFEPKLLHTVRGVGYVVKECS